MIFLTLTPVPACQVDDRVPREILAAAEAASWPAVLIQPHIGVTSYDDGRNIQVQGADGRAAFVQMMNASQMLAARRLLLCLNSGQPVEEAVAYATSAPSE